MICRGTGGDRKRTRHAIVVESLASSNCRRDFRVSKILDANGNAFWLSLLRHGVRYLNVLRLKL